jgi:maleate isomerase
VVNVGLAAAGQFDQETILAAADLLADAQVDSIVWSGTSGGWRGIADDQALCAAITARTGRPATTSTLALIEALRRSGIRSIGLVTPYPPDMHDAVVATLKGEGFDVVASAALPSTASNWELSLITPDEIGTGVKQVADSPAEAIAIFCTNLAAADHAEEWEQAYGVPILDTVALAVWHGLELASYSGPAPQGWGGLFR